ncbi:MAG: response regulator [Methanomicrobia archaeon]|nr:response regulator [Methanomicrobia archaeon]
MDVSSGTYMLNGAINEMSGDGGEMRILIIDDEMEILTLFKDFLESVGHKVEMAIDGEMGLEKFEDGSEFDLVVMDYRMYGKDGIQVSKDILNIDKNAKILFASADNSVKNKAIDMGAVGFLLKPFDIDVMIREIERVYTKG